jgi:hypothetical protein
MRIKLETGVYFLVLLNKFDTVLSCHILGCEMDNIFAQQPTRCLAFDRCTNFINPLGKC